ncbi:MAG TPA: diguanylate cyclase [Planctomycetota bacterium]|jgi:diguanylate cyclase (GGDEF)-like protein|nr:diguanylate cyclase [Planctomycetota bacterium]
MATRSARKLRLRVDFLPTPSFVAVRVLERGLDEKARPQELAELVAWDPALAASVLRAVNAPGGGLSVEVGDLVHAATILGTKGLRPIVLGVTVVEDAGETGALDLARFWRHSGAAATAARLLAKACGRDPDEAHLAGLLHDLGILVLDRHDPKAYAGVLRLAASRPAASLAALERARLGIDHDRAAERVAAAWSFPAELSSALRSLPDPAADASGLGPLLRAADLLAWQAGFSPFDASKPPDRDPAVRALLRPFDERELLEAVRDEVARRCARFGDCGEPVGGIHRAIARANAALSRLVYDLEASIRSLRTLNAAMLNVQARLGERDPAEALLCEIVATLGFDRAFLVAAEGKEEATIRRALSTTGAASAVEGRSIPGIRASLASVRKAVRLERGDGHGFEDLLDALDADGLILAPLSSGPDGCCVVAVDRGESGRSVEDRDAAILGPLALETGLLLENYRLVQTVRSMAVTDALTGVFNRRRLMEVLAKEHERALLTHRPLAVVMLDLDHFKRVNDTLGHAVGDDLLRRFGDLLRDNLRRGDVVGRYGGEEFVVLLPGADVERATAVAERIRVAFNAFGDQEAGAYRGLRLSVSAGVATLSGEGESHEALLCRADAALYAAKAAGRDRTCTAPAGASGPEGTREGTPPEGIGPAGAGAGRAEGRVEGTSHPA